MQLLSWKYEMSKLDQSHIVMENWIILIFSRKRQKDMVLCSVFLPSTSLGRTLGFPLPPDAGPIVVTSPDSLFCNEPNVMFLDLNLSQTSLIESFLPWKPGKLDWLYKSIVSCMSCSRNNPVFLSLWLDARTLATLLLALLCFALTMALDLDLFKNFLLSEELALTFFVCLVLAIVHNLAKGKNITLISDLV